MRILFSFSVGISFLFAAEMELFPNWQNYFILRISIYLDELDCALVNLGTGDFAGVAVGGGKVATILILLFLMN
jgi:hypothetical protein